MFYAKMLTILKMKMKIKLNVKHYIEFNEIENCAVLIIIYDKILQIYVERHLKKINYK